MSSTQVLPGAVEHTEPVLGDHKVQFNIVLFDPQEEAEKVRGILPFPTTDEEWVEYKFRLNCLLMASGTLDQLEHCFINVGKRQIVAEFASACKNAATCSLWKRITTLCDALEEALREINLKTDGKYTKLQNDIFAWAHEESQQPKKEEHWGYADCSFDAELLRMSMLEQVHEITSMAEHLLSGWHNDFLKGLALCTAW